MCVHIFTFCTSRCTEKNYVRIWMHSQVQFCLYKCHKGSLCTQTPKMCTFVYTPSHLEQKGNSIPSRLCEQSAIKVEHRFSLVIILILIHGLKRIQSFSESHGKGSDPLAKGFESKEDQLIPFQVDSKLWLMPGFMGRELLETEAATVSRRPLLSVYSQSPHPPPSPPYPLVCSVFVLSVCSVFHSVCLFTPPPIFTRLFTPCLFCLFVCSICLHCFVCFVEKNEKNNRQ